MLDQAEFFVLERRDGVLTVRAAQIVYTGQGLPAAEAQRFGVVDEVPPQQLLEQRSR